MDTHVNQIINFLMHDKCFTEMKDQNGQFDKRNNQYILHVLHDLKTKEHLEPQLHVLLPIKSVMSQSEDLLQYFNALVNAIHMDAINKKIQSINLTCHIIHNQMFATVIKRGYQAEIEFKDWSYDENNSFIQSINEVLERIKHLISKLYPMMNDINSISRQTDIIKKTFKRQKSFNPVIERLSNSINNDAEKILEYKKSLLTFN